MSIIETLLTKIVLHDCVNCGAEGRLLCSTCTQKLPAPITCCYRCQHLAEDFLTCPACRRSTSLLQVRSAVAYDAAAKTLAWKLKSSGAQAAAGIMAECLLPLVVSATRSNPIIIPVPTTADRARQRGFDQAKLLARQLGRKARLPWADCLIRSDRAHQVGANRQQRRQQLQTAFRVKNTRQVRNAVLILIDDVVTTGSTLEAAARTLNTAGAAYITALTFAQTP